MRCGRPSAAKNCSMRSICQKVQHNFHRKKRHPISHNKIKLDRFSSMEKLWQSFSQRRSACSDTKWISQKNKKQSINPSCLISFQYGVLQLRFLQSQTGRHDAEDVVMSSIQLSPLGFTFLFQLLLKNVAKKTKIILKQSINIALFGLELLLRQV